MKTIYRNEEYHRNEEKSHINEAIYRDAEDMHVNEQKRHANEEGDIQ